MADLDLGKQLGPLPLGAWVAVVGGGLGIAWYTRRNPAAANPVITDDVSGADGVGQGGSWMAVPPPTGAAPTAPPPSTNEEWARLAINWLIAQGYDPAMSDSAIRKYLEVQQLSSQEYALLQAELRHRGSPPIRLQPPPPPPVIPPPLVKPPEYKPPPVVQPPPVEPPTTPKLRFHVITPWPTQTSTLWGIAVRYYGNGNRWPELYNVNREGYRRPDGSVGWIKNPNLIYAGRTVWVP